MLKPKIQKSFISQYGITYAYIPDEPVEVVTARIETLGKLFEIPMKEYPACENEASQAIKEKRKVYFHERQGFVETNIYDGLKIEPGNVIEDGAIIEYPHTTIVIRPNQRALCDNMRNMIIDIE